MSRVDEFTYDHLKRFYTAKGLFPSFDELCSAIKKAHRDLYDGKVLYYIGYEGYYMQYALVSKAQDDKLQALPECTKVFESKSSGDYLFDYTTTSRASTIHEIMHEGTRDVSDVLQALADKS